MIKPTSDKLGELGVFEFKALIDIEQEIEYPQTKQFRHYLYMSMLVK